MKNLLHTLTAFADDDGNRTSNDRDMINMCRDVRALATKVAAVLDERARQAKYAALVDHLGTLDLDGMTMSELTATGATPDEVTAAMAQLGYFERTRNHVRRFCRD